jgi:hypothetical protein
MNTKITPNNSKTAILKLTESGVSASAEFIFPSRNWGCFLLCVMPHSPVEIHRDPVGKHSCRTLGFTHASVRGYLFLLKSLLIWR